MKDRIEQMQTKAQALPRARLGFFPTPLHRLDRLSEQLGVNLYIKRDDLTGMNLFGGNKIRKLEYLMGDIVRQGYDTVLTYGAVQSNHAMQTATACRRLGLHPVLCLNPCSERDARNVRANLLLNRILGAEVHVLDYVPDEPEAQMKRRRQALGRARMDELAREVIRGDWGNGEEHRQKLTAAGYDYAAVQSRVNEILGGSAKPAASCETYTVAKNDTLWGIAKKELGNGARYTEIKALNGLTSDTIYAGQKLKIPQ